MTYTLKVCFFTSSSLHCNIHFEIRPIQRAILCCLFPFKYQPNIKQYFKWTKDSRFKSTTKEYLLYGIYKHFKETNNNEMP
jgi:hypothetical protein